MIRSRLRRPTSKSMTAVLWPARARPEAKLALVVVLPTPPLPDVTTMILAMGFPVGSGPASRGGGCGFKCFHHEPAFHAAFQPDLRRLAEHLGGQGGRAGAG